MWIWITIWLTPSSPHRHQESAQCGHKIKIVQSNDAQLQTYQPVQARKSLGPISLLSFTKLNMKVYIITVGSATPSISNGWPPRMECMIPQKDVEAKVCTAVRVPSVQKHKNYMLNLRCSILNIVPCPIPNSCKDQIILLVAPSSCSPNEITGNADAKKMYVVGAKILHLNSRQKTSRRS